MADLATDIFISFVHGISGHPYVLKKVILSEKKWIDFEKGIIVWHGRFGYRYFCCLRLQNFVHGRNGHRFKRPPVRARERGISSLVMSPRPPPPINRPPPPQGTPDMWGPLPETLDYLPSWEDVQRSNGTINLLTPAPSPLVRIWYTLIWLGCTSR